ncbi:hypothetical protein Tco_0765972 [Tanacetum coccineum]
MNKISIVVHHEDTFIYDPLIYNDIDVDIVENVNLGNLNYKRLFKIITECCVFPVDGMHFCAPKQDIDKHLKPIRNDDELVNFAKLGTFFSNSRDVGVEDSFVDDRFKVKERFSNDYKNISVLYGRNMKEGMRARQKGKKVDEDIGTPKSMSKSKAKQSKSSKGKSKSKSPKKTKSPKKSQSSKTPKATPNVDAARKFWGVMGGMGWKSAGLLDVRRRGFCLVGRVGEWFVPELHFGLYLLSVVKSCNSPFRILDHRIGRWAGRIMGVVDGRVGVGNGLGFVGSLLGGLGVLELNVEGGGGVVDWN